MKTIVTLLLAGTALFIGMPAHAEGPLVLKFSHVVKPQTPKGRAAEQFKKLVEERSQGQIKVEVHAGGQLFADNEEMHALRSGEVHFLAPSVSKFAPLGVPDFEVFDVPYLITSDAAWRKATQGAVAAGLLKKLESRGIVGLAYWGGGLNHLLANRDLRRPADLKGLKLRIQPSKMTELMARSAGVVPLPLPFSGVSEALRAGVVDGVESTASNIYTAGFYRVQKAMTLTGHSYLGYAVITNKRFWDALPDQTRKLLQNAMADASQFQATITEEDNRQALEAIGKSGQVRVIQPTAGDLAEWKKAFTKARPEYERRVGVEAIRALEQELGVAR